MAAGLAGFTKVLTPAAVDRMNGLGDSLRDRSNALAAKHGLPLQATGTGSIFGLHFHKGPIRNSHDLDAGEQGRERDIAALKKLYQLDMFERGLYVTRRILGNLSLVTSEADVDLFVDALEEFLVSRATLIRQALD